MVRFHYVRWTSPIKLETVSVHSNRLDGHLQLYQKWPEFKVTDKTSTSIKPDLEWFTLFYMVQVKYSFFRPFYLRYSSIIDPSTVLLIYLACETLQNVFKNGYNAIYFIMMLYQEKYNAIKWFLMWFFLFYVISMMS